MGVNVQRSFYVRVTELTYTAEELEELNRKENTPTTYVGKKYTKYEALQHQRKI